MPIFSDLDRGTISEITLLNDNKRTATVTAKGRCETLELTSHEFKRLVASRPEIARKLRALRKRASSSIKKYIQKDSFRNSLD